ncbi:hypothetical protein EDS67_22870 [candidate division KSB1 bacterium]|nr:MAG: hypothetical protein EDS67_22870 [candidate division KSB1 bacterium]MBC6952539.1 hypothetical protein [candidate division KSB1 bacterium]MCE7944120.1 hypothetical protein [Chlorobi bacterium CHB1]MDL1876325.1 hypothetical protein [Cytophagia bacterium CHB2]
MNRFLIVTALLFSLAAAAAAQDRELARIILTEPIGLARSREYVKLSLQAEAWALADSHAALLAIDAATQRAIPCQVFNQQLSANGEAVIFSVIFPVTLQAGETKILSLRTSHESGSRSQPVTDLLLEGKGTELRIANKFYVADLRRSERAEPQSHASGQIRELLIEEFNQLLTNAEDRLHWAPNFKRPGMEYYTTIAHWNEPRVQAIDNGGYLIQTRRQDLAPGHPEILLTAVYSFYAEVPYFEFYSSMEVTEDLWLELLRNDEMTMDSMFTHLAFQRPEGEIVDVPFSERYEMLQQRPIENEAPWLCFYHAEKQYAFGSIRLQYDLTNALGEPSPTYQAHTQIGEWLGGIKYWNRRLIHDHLTFVPKGSRYVERNAYVVFRIGAPQRFEAIENLARQLRNPIRVSVLPQ